MAESSASSSAVPNTSPVAEKAEEVKIEAKDGAEESSLAVPAEKKGVRAKRQPKKDLVPLFVQERGHGRDGELLRDFILKREHLKEDQRELAVKRWLIREDFFDEFFQEYLEHYAQAGEVESIEDSELEEKAHQLVEACKDIMVSSKGNQKVEDLERVSKSNDADVYALRDTLLQAVKELSTPRRRLGVDTKHLMDDDAKDLLKKKEQSRLRQVVFNCLKGIWESGIGGEVLKIALDSVKSRIDRFKAKGGEDLIQAMAGQEWAQLEDLIQVIEEKENIGVRQVLGPIEGRRTKLVIGAALESLGGKGTSRQVIEWIEQHPEELEKLREVKLNKHVRDGHRRPVWHSTVTSSMHHFRKVTRPGQPVLYLAENAEMPEELPAIQDAAPKPRASRAKRPAEKAEKAAPEKPKAKPKRARKAKTVAPAAEPPVEPVEPAAEPPVQPPGPPRAPEASAPSAKRAKKNDDPLSSALDAALAAAMMA